MDNKKLYLSNNKIIGGVCGGVAEYFGIDPTIVRIGWVLLTYFNGIGLLAYIAGLVIIPTNPYLAVSENQDPIIKIKDSINHFTTKIEANSSLSGNNTYRTIGLALVVIGILILTKDFIPSIPWKLLWPLILISLGVVILKKGSS